MSTLRVDNIQDQGGAERRGLKTYAVINDSKADNADGGTFTTGAWRTRDLNTELADPDGIVSISSNQFTLGAGSYLIKFSAPAYQVNSHQTRLYDVTGAAAVALGSAEFAAQATTNVTNRSFGVARITISANNVYEIQHRGAATRSTFGLGIGTAGNMNWGSGTPGTVYTIVEIYKEA